jgi:hypothetical protein
MEVKDSLRPPLIRLTLVLGSIVLSRAGILEESIGARHRVGIGFMYRARIFKLLRSLEINFKESIS